MHIPLSPSLTHTHTHQLEMMESDLIEATADLKSTQEVLQVTEIKEKEGRKHNEVNATLFV